MPVTRSSKAIKKRESKGRMSALNLADSLKSINSVAKAEECSSRLYPRAHDRSDLLKWPILEMLPTEFLANIHMAYVYGSEALVVTNNDKVYALGKNSLGCLEGAKCGEDSPFHPREVQELSGKNIKTFCYATDSTVVALGNDGTMYFSEGVGFVVLDSSINFIQKANNVRSICCQQKQIFVLFEDGQVSVWKKDLPAISLTQNQITPSIPKGKTSDIDCTQSACVGLTTEGDVYVWYNSTSIPTSSMSSTRAVFGGISPCQPMSTTFAAQMLLKKINLHAGIKIEKVACGYDHILALSESGEVYASGSNYCGQLGYGTGPTATSSNQEESFTSSTYVTNTALQQVSIPTMGRVVDIAATHLCNISVAATSCGKILMWGDCGGVIVKTPIVTPYTSVHEVFGKFARKKLMHKPLIVDVNHESYNILHSLESAFDDLETSDFTVQVEGKPIHVHKAILRINSEYFRNMFKANWVESKKDVLEHEEFSYDVYKAFLQYLYTGRVGLSPRDSLDLLRLSNQYLDNRLQKLCKESVVKGLAISNVLQVFVTARQHSLKNLEDISLSFIMRHFTAVVETEEFLSLDGEIAKELIRTAAGKGMIKK